MEIDITKEKERFSTFLAEEDNTNIIFSGIFGIGKTYFIHKFFDDNTCYTPIFLSPVQYSVASNEDIFELIKFDILYQLINKGVKFDRLELSFLDSAQWLLYFNIDDFIIKLLQVTSKVKLGVDILSPFVNLKKKIEDYKSKVEKLSEDSLVDEFISKNKNKIGSIYEENVITQLISSCVLSLKEEGKKIILVIDDLDRIDPEHIFRILNILSVHENFYGEKEDNKFEFDKTILICDANNIKKIYHSKYGIDVDFNGYIDKFYSKRIYYFDNTSQIIDRIVNLLSSVRSGNLAIENSSRTTQKACNVILAALVKRNKLNIRDLLKIKNVTVENNRKICISNSVSVWMANYPCLVIFDFIKSMFCTIGDMESAILNLSDNDVIVEEPQNFLTIFLILVDFEQNRFEEGEHCCLEINYKIESGNRYLSTLPMTSYGGNKLIKSINMKDAVVKSFTNYKKYFL